MAKTKSGLKYNVKTITALTNSCSQKQPLFYNLFPKDFTTKNHGYNKKIDAVRYNRV